MTAGGHAKLSAAAASVLNRDCYLSWRPLRPPPEKALPKHCMLAQELASAKTAAKAAEAAAEKLAGQKAALLQELAFNHGAAKRGESCHSVPCWHAG